MNKKKKKRPKIYFHVGDKIEIFYTSELNAIIEIIDRETMQLLDIIRKKP